MAVIAAAPMTRALIAVVFVALLATVLRVAWMGDDAYITFRVVDNLVNGFGPRWNVSERVQAYTHPLWMALIAAGYVVTREPYFTTIVLSLLMTAFTAWVLAARLSRSVSGALIGLALLMCSQAFVDYSTSGLENPLSHALAALFVWLWLDDRDDDRDRSVGLFATAAFLVLTRVDLVLLVLPALSMTLWRQRRTDGSIPWNAALLGLTPVMVWEIFSVVYYGFPFPNTAYAKLKTGVDTSALIAQGQLYFADSFMRDPVTLVTIAVGIIAACTARTRGVALAAGVVLYLGYVLSIGGDFMSGRFFTAPFVIAVGVVVHLLPLDRPVVVDAAGFAVFVFFILDPPMLRPIVVPDSQARAIPQTGIADERLFYARRTALFRPDGWMQPPAIPDAGMLYRLRQGRVITDEGVGFIGFAGRSGTHIVDVMGLTDPLLARLPASRPWRIGHYRRQIPAGYLETLRGESEGIHDSGVAAYYDQLRTITQGPLWSGERWVAIARVNLGLEEHLIAGNPQ